MSFDPDATRLETQLYRRSLMSVASKLRKTRGAKRIDVLLGSTIHNGELFPATMLVEERNVAIDLLANTDTMIEDLQDQLMLVRQDLTEVHETLDSQCCIKGSKLDDVSSRHAQGCRKSGRGPACDRPA